MDDDTVYQIADGEAPSSAVDVLGTAVKVVLVHGAVGDADVSELDVVLRDKVLSPLPQIPVGGQQVDGSDVVMFVCVGATDGMGKVSMVGKCCVLHLNFLAFAY